MELPFHLGLRHDRHMVGLIRQNDRSRVQLGTAYPQSSDPRARILAQWGTPAPSPRRNDPETVDMPLPRRAQAALAYQVAPEMRHELATGFGATPASRKEAGAGLLGRAHLGDLPLMDNRPRGFGAGRHGGMATDGKAPSGRARY
ncbi:MAG TPA: hypothetical protein VF801_11140 [Rhodocyclaceae bacterium]